MIRQTFALFLILLSSPSVVRSERFHYIDPVVPGAEAPRFDLPSPRRSRAPQSADISTNSQASSALSFVDWVWDRDRCNVTIGSVIANGSITGPISLGVNVGNVSVNCW